MHPSSSTEEGEGTKREGDREENIMTVQKLLFTFEDIN